MPSELCTDAEFLRRVSLDLTGTLPTPRGGRGVPGRHVARQAGEEDRRAAGAADLRRLVGDASCATSPATTPHSCKRASTSPAEYARQWYDWIYARVAENVPYDKLVAGIVLAQSAAGRARATRTTARRSSRTTASKDPADFTAARDDALLLGPAEHAARPRSGRWASATPSWASASSAPSATSTRSTSGPRRTSTSSQAFFARVRLRHRPPTDRKTSDDARQLGVEPDSKRTNGNELQDGKLAQAGRRRQGDAVPWRMSCTRRERATATVEKTKASSRIEPQPRVDHAKRAGRRGGRPDAVRRPAAAADGLAAAATDNPYFARAFVNRVWANYFDVGIIDPPDDLNLANPPSNAALLDYLAAGFVEHGFDMKWLHREIVNSRRLPALAGRPNETNQLDERNFSRAVAAPPAGRGAVSTRSRRRPPDRAELARAATTSESRAIGLEGDGARGGGGHGNGDYALTVFGRPPRDEQLRLRALERAEPAADDLPAERPGDVLID